MSKKFEKYLNEDKDFSGDIEDAYRNISKTIRMLDKVVDEIKKDSSRKIGGSD